MIVRATDLGVIPQRSNASVTIRIIRERNPYFSESEHRVTLLESTPINNQIVDLEAIDPLRVSFFPSLEVAFGGFRKSYQRAHNLTVNCFCLHSVFCLFFKV